MSTLEIKNRLPERLSARYASDDVVGLRWYEKVLLGIVIFELPLQIDTFLMYREQNGELGAIGGVSVSVGLIAMIPIYVLWLIQKFDVASKPIKNKVYGWPMLAYMAAGVVAILAADVKALAVFDLIITFQAYLLFFYIANRVRTTSDVNFMLLMLCSTVIFQSLLIFVTNAFADQLYTGERVKFGPISVEIGEDGRPGGSLHSPTLAGSYLALLWLPAMAMLITPKKGLFRLIAAATVILGGMAILTTQTRGAILSTFLGSVTLSLFCLRRGWFPVRLIALGCLLGAIGIVPLIGVIQNRVNREDNGSAEARIHLSQIAFESIKEHPLFGVGGGNCHLVGMKYANQGEYRALWYFTVHCKYLLVWLENGLFGLIAFLCIFAAGIRDSYSVWRTRHRFFAPLGIGIMVAILGYMLHMVVDIFNSRPQVHSMWALLALVAAMRMIAKEEVAKGNFGEEASDDSDDSQSVRPRYV